MKINKYNIRHSHNRVVNFTGIITILVMIFLLPLTVNGQTLLNEKESKKKVKEIIATYNEWKSAAWQGKVKSDMLPVSITAKVFLKNDELIMVSLRAPLIGEVARVEIDPQSVLVVNKMKRRYWKKDISDVDKMMPGSFECLQSLLLGRVFIIGEGELTVKNGTHAGYYSLGDDITLIAPMIPVAIEDFNYGFALNGADELINLMMQYTEIDGSDEMSYESTDDNVTIEALEEGKQIKYDFTVEITPKGNGADAKAVLIAPGMNYSLTVDGGKIQWGAEGFARLTINNNYQSTTLRECLRF